VILNNLYGVDIDEGAVEICKLRLWLSMVADIEDEPNEVEPLPNIEFNIRQGNSLIGFTDVLNSNKKGETSATSWNLYSQYQDLIDAVQKHRGAESAEAATEARKVAEELIEEQRSDFDDELITEFQNAGIDIESQEELEAYSPLHWPLEFAEVWESGRFDIVIGNPPWEVLASNREDYFTKYVPEFRTLPDSKKDAKQEELLEDEEIAEGWEQHKDQMRTLSSLITNGSLFNLQSPDVGGQGRHDLSALFTERVFSLASEEAYVAQIVPNKIFIGTSTADIRQHLLSDTAIQDIVSFENKGIFQDIDDRHKFGILTFRNGGSTDELNGKFLQHGTDILRNLDEETFVIPRRVLEDFSPVVGMFPQIQEQEEVDLLDKLIQHPAISKEAPNGWYINIHNEELNRTRDSDRFFEDKSKGDYPVYGGGNFWQFEHDDELTSNLSPPTLWSVDEDREPEKSAKRRIRKKDIRRLKRKIYHSLDGTGTQKSFVNSKLEEHSRDELSLDDVLLDCDRYRLVFRDIANATNERSLIATVLPPGIVCHNKAPVIRPHRIEPSESDLGDTPLHSVFKRIFTDEELFTALGLLNSIPFDYLVRTKLDTSMSVYVLEESQMPRLTQGDNWFNFIADRAARLNCYGDSFEQMRERLGEITPVTNRAKRNKLQAEIDAAAFHAYGLERGDVRYVLDDFHQVQSPRIMTDEYLDMVLEKFDVLEQEGPKP
jgi:hypothetical protein